LQNSKTFLPLQSQNEGTPKGGKLSATLGKQKERPEAVSVGLKSQKGPAQRQPRNKESLRQAIEKVL